MKYKNLTHMVQIIETNRSIHVQGKETVELEAGEENHPSILSFVRMGKGSVTQDRTVLPQVKTIVKGDANG